MYNKILQKIGLSEKESSVYIDLLNHPNSRMIDISRRTGIHRPALYAILPHLRERRIIYARARGRQQYYEAASPEVLRELLDELEKRFSQVLPDLQSLYDAKSHHVNIVYYDGIVGIRRLYEHIVQVLPPDAHYMAYTGRHSKASKEYFTEKFWKTRDEKRLTRYIIASEERVQGIQVKPRQEIAILPLSMTTGLFEKNMVKIIYGNYVAIIDFTDDTGVVMESPLFASMESDIFRLLFRFLQMTRK